MPNKFTLASLHKRVIAIIIDYSFFIMFHAFFLIQFGRKTPEQFGSPGYELDGLLNLVPFVIWIITFPVMESFEGQSIGKKICSLKVIKQDASELNLTDCFKRRVLDWVDFALLGLPAIIVSNNTPYRQRLGDLWARTVVVDSREVILE